MAGRRHLVLQLRQGWTYDSRSRRFIKNKQDAFRPGDDLPKYTRIQFQVPAMARKRERTPVEDDLARLVQVVPPKAAEINRLRERLESWPCVEKVWVAPAPLPAGK